jgi:hypothetical protein
LKRMTEVHVSPEWEASLLACLDYVPARVVPWMSWVYGGLAVTSGLGLAGVFMFVHL